jgi:Zn-dependent oligopeptidase
MELLERVWTPAKASADRERAALEAFVKEEYMSKGKDKGDGKGGDAAAAPQLEIQPWDWRYYAEKVNRRSGDVHSGHNE